MGKIEAPKRIRAEDYESDDRPLINRLSATINNFHEQVYQTLNRNIDFENLTQSIVDVIVVRDNAALPASSLKQRIPVKSGLNRKILGAVCISATNTDDITMSPESQPFVTFTLSSIGFLTIEKVTGLQANSSYSLKLLLIT